MDLSDPRPPAVATGNDSDPGVLGGEQESRAEEPGRAIGVGVGPGRRPLALMPVDWLLAAYLGATGLLLLARGPIAGSGVPLLVRTAFFALLWIARGRKIPPSGLGGFVRRAYPVLLSPYFYAELATLNDLVYSSYHDATVLTWERALFGSMPSVDLRHLMPWPLLSEFLHFAYFSYYLMVPFLIIVLWLKRKPLAVTESVLSVMIGFVICYVFFIVFPVRGPFHELTPPDPGALGWFWPRVAHAVLHRASSVGTAFPSSHVAVAVAVLMQALRHDRFAGWVMGVLVPALALGAVYGGFHYAVDATAGLMAGVLAVALGRFIFRRAGVA